MGNKLYVGNLDYQTTSEDLKELFTGAGEVRSAQVIMDRETQQSKGFAFIEMGDDAEALRAISLYNGRVLNERALQVREALPRSAGASARPSGGPRSGPRFREVKHKARGGRKARNW